MAKKRRKKKNKVGKIIFILELFILLVLIGFVFVYAKISNKMDKVKTKSLDLAKVEINEQVVESEVLKGFQNIMLVGVDSREGDLNYANSDTMIIASINNDTKEVRLVSIYRDTLLNVGDNTYRKANYAYAAGGAEDLLSMVNKNLDLNISDYVTVDFNALSTVVDQLGGIEIALTEQEIVHLNNYCVETSKVTGKDYEKLPKDAGTYQLNGVQATSYARIRYTAGNDFKRTQRQRLVVEKIVEKAKTASLSTLNSIMDQVFPMVKTSFTKTKMIKLGASIRSYALGATSGFPFDHLEVDKVGGKKYDAVIPVTLANNVIQLHQFLFNDEGYNASDTCQSISNDIVNSTGLGRDSIEKAKKISEGAIPNIGSESDSK